MSRDIVIFCTIKILYNDGVCSFLQTIRDMTLRLYIVQEQLFRYELFIVYYQYLTYNAQEYVQDLIIRY